MPALQRALLRPLTRVELAARNGARDQRTTGAERLSAPGRWIALAATVGALAASRPLRAQPAYVRFDITTVGDSTFSFATPGVRWVKRSQRGLVVDPLHGDELIAKFRVTRTRSGTATAIVTGQTERLAITDVALLDKPRPLFLTRPWFWLGMVAGGAIGYIAHGR